MMLRCGAPILPRFVLEVRSCTKPHNHSLDPASGKRISVGLDPHGQYRAAGRCGFGHVPTRWPCAGVHVHLCVYHPSFIAHIAAAWSTSSIPCSTCRRSYYSIDPLQQPAIRKLIDAHPEKNQPFIVLGSPVTGERSDHDHDRAVVEPSSMRSLIQLAGRNAAIVLGAVDGANVLLLDSTLRAYEHGQGRRQTGV